MQLYIYGSLSRLRASRRLAQETPRNVALLWLVKQLRPAHKTMADFRPHHLAPLRQVCRECTLLCQPRDLFAGARVAIDGSQCNAGNAKERHFTQNTRKRLLPQIDQRVEGSLKALDPQDSHEAAGTPGGAVAAH